MCPTNNLSIMENLSLTRELVGALNRFSKNRSMGKQVGAKVLAFFSTPLTSLIDTVAHAALTIFKTVFSLLIAHPYNFIAALRKKNGLSRDFHIGSVIFHIRKVCFHSLNIGFLPLHSIYKLGHAAELSEKSKNPACIKELNFKIQEQNELLEAYEQEINDCKEFMQRRSDLTLNLEKENSELEKENVRLTVSLGSIESKIDECESEVTLHQSQIVKLKNAYETLVKEHAKCQEYTKRQEALKAEIQSKESQFNNIQKNFIQLQTTHQELVDEHKKCQEVDKLNGHIEKLKEIKQGLAQELEQMINKKEQIFKDN